MRIVVNHLTRMQPGYICVAGIDVQDNEHIRPVLGREQLTVGLLARNGGAFDMGRLVDQHAFVSFRNSKSSSASDPHEIEANQFAAALLMPEAFLRACLDQLGENPDVEESIRRLAQRFDVSAQAMTIRLTSLGEITPAFG